MQLCNSIAGSLRLMCPAQHALPVRVTVARTTYVAFPSDVATFSEVSDGNFYTRGSGHPTLNLHATDLLHHRP